jgi:hypothetical protein
MDKRRGGARRSKEDIGGFERYCHLPAFKRQLCRQCLEEFENGPCFCGEDDWSSENGMCIAINFNLSQKSKNIPNPHGGYGTGYLTRLEGTGMLRVDKGQPIPLPSLPYPQPVTGLKTRHGFENP